MELHKRLIESLSILCVFDKLIYKHNLIKPINTDKKIYFSIFKRQYKYKILVKTSKHQKRIKTLKYAIICLYIQ